MPINTPLLQSDILAMMQDVESFCKTYNPNVHSLPVFQSQVKQLAAVRLAMAHTTHVLSATPQGVANVATVPSAAPIVAVLI